LPTLTESAFATLFALADLLAPASIQRGIDGGEDVLAAGGPEFGLDLPPADSFAEPRPGATASTVSSAISTISPSPASKIR
jgi:hypothetical protein